MLWNIAVNDAGAAYDPLTLLRTRTMFGRPDWMTIFGQMKQAIETGQYIPGSKSQLKTKVAVGALCMFDGLCLMTGLDILLRAWRSCISNQGGYYSTQQFGC